MTLIRWLKSFIGSLSIDNLNSSFLLDPYKFTHWLFRSTWHGTIFRNELYSSTVQQVETSKKCVRSQICQIRHCSSLTGPTAYDLKGRLYLFVEACEGIENLFFICPLTFNFRMFFWWSSTNLDLVLDSDNSSFTSMLILHQYVLGEIWTTEHQASMVTTVPP